MATPLPAKLKTADISRFALRAAQLEKIKPVISYWCEYYILQQVLGKELHKADKECEAYAINLMTKLEETKSRQADNDAITDDVAAQAFVEQFAIETFQRADNAVRANKASAQTADTFRAAATFFDMLAIWQQPLDAEIAAKSKYAKYHALRIAKALKAGEDPNLSNPKTEPEPSEGLPTSPPVLDPNDPEVQRINHPNAYHQPSVESASQSNPTSPPLPPLSGPLPPHDISPISPPDDIPTRSSAAGEPSSPGGGYFPRVPTFTSETSASTLPTAPAEETLPDPSPSIPTQLPQPPQAQQPQAHQPPQPPRQPQFSSSQTFAPTSDSTSPASFYQQPSLPQPPAVPPTQSFPQPSYSQPPVVPQPPLPPAPAQSAFNPSPAAATRYQPDEDAMMSAQKHAKWAISALNFEDVDTAVRELRAALHELTGN